MFCSFWANNDSNGREYKALRQSNMVDCFEKSLFRITFFAHSTKSRSSSQDGVMFIPAESRKMIAGNLRFNGHSGDGDSHQQT